jgi:Tol biopolymer transport system component
MRILFISTVIYLFLFNPVFSGDRVIQFEDFFSVSRLGTPVISPDGNQLAFTVKKANIDDNSYSTQIWMMNNDGTDLRQLTTNPASNTSPVFSPDGKYLYLLNKQSGSMQVSRLNLGSGQIDQVTDLYGDINGFYVSPQNTHLLLERRVPPDCSNEASIQEKGEIEKNKVVEARIIDHLMYRHWNEWLEGKFSHLFISSIEGKDPKDLTPGLYHTPPIGLGSGHDYSFSPDGKEVCFVSNHDPQVAISTNNDVFITNLQGNQTEKISVSKGNDNQPHYSPNGKYIAYVSMDRAGFEADRQRINN